MKKSKILITAVLMFLFTTCIAPITTFAATEIGDIEIENVKFNYDPGDAPQANAAPMDGWYGLYNVEYTPNTSVPTFDVSVEQVDDNRWKIDISNIQYQNGYIQKWKVKYKLSDSEKWNTSDNLSFIVSEIGKYNIIIFNGDIKSAEENEENMMWFMNNHPFKLESLDPYLPEELHSETTALGYLQLLPGIHKTDGFFIARFRRK